MLCGTNSYVVERNQQNKPQAALSTQIYLQRQEIESPMFLTNVIRRLPPTLYHSPLHYETNTWGTNPEKQT